LSDGKVLLVEDNPDDRDLMLRALAARVAIEEVATVSDGAEALDYLFAEGAHVQRALPKVVLLDLKLPKVDGFEVLRRMRADARTRRVPVVVVTSSDEERDIEACYEHGANSYIRKPVDFQHFRAAVDQVERYWLGLNVTPSE